MVQKGHTKRFSSTISQNLVIIALRPSVIMENFSVDEVSDLLREHKTPEQLIETLAGTYNVGSCKYYCRCVNYKMYVFLTDNHIDGVALFALPEDFEFKCVVPQSGLRLRLKTLLRNLRASFSPFTVSHPNSMNIISLT